MFIDRKVSIVKMLFLPNLIFRVKIIPIKISARYLRISTGGS